MNQASLRERLQEKFFAESKSNPTVLVFGLGTSGGGVGVAKFFAELGYRVIVTDTKTKKELAVSLKALRSYKIQYVLGKHNARDFQHADLIVKNPSVPHSHPLLKSAKRVTSDAEIFLTVADRKKIIGITGTKGKTTTSMLTQHLLGNEAILVGTPGISFFECFFTQKKYKWIVAEFSSFDLEIPKVSPHISVFTSLFPDHLNRYISFAKYARAKMRIIQFQEKGDRAFVWKSKNTKKYLPKTQGKIFWMSEGTINAPWNLSRHAVIMASAVASTLGVSKALVARRLRSFQPPHGRLEIVASAKGYTFVNDTTSTNPGSASFSLGQLIGHFKKAVIIAGGEDKNFPVSSIKEYADALRALRLYAIILPGSFSDRLIKFLPQSSFECAVSMESAVKQATKKGKVIALIPGAASFNMFVNEFDRGEKFTRASKKFLHNI